MRNRFLRVLAASLAAALVLAACGSDDADTAAPEAPEPEPAAEEGEEGDDAPPADGPAYETVFPVYDNPSIPELDIIFERDRFTIVMHTVPAKNLFWSQVFDEVNIVYSDDAVAPLVSGAAWIVQAEPALLWPALEQGVIDAVTVAVTNDAEQWLMLAAPGIETPEDVVGKRITGGTIGDSWNTIARIILRDHLGVDPDDMEWVSVSGGSDSRMDAVLAGQVDLAMAQLRNLAPVEEIGGSAIFNQRVDSAQTQLVVMRDTLENNYDAVCAAVEGQFAGQLWMDDGDDEYELDQMRNVWPMLVDEGYAFDDPDALWIAGYPGTHSRDAGASVAAFDTQMEIHKGADDPVISQDFDWRDHVDFTCLWELQEAYGVPLRPDPNEL